MAEKSEESTLLINFNQTKTGALYKLLSEADNGTQSKNIKKIT